MALQPARILISLVVPFHNEEKNVHSFFDRVFSVLRKIQHADFEVVCINDGSRDGTLKELKTVADFTNKLFIIDLSRNFGKEAALTAGIDAAIGDVVIPMDCDLQHPPEIIPDLLAKWREGYEVVLPRRTSRNTDRFIQRHTANWFYQIYNWIADCKIPENVGDFRLMDRAVVEAIKSLPERRRFMKGIFAWVGFKTTHVDYFHEHRNAGQSNFNGRKLWNLALEGIFSFSTVPLILWTYIGVFISLLSLSYGSWIVIRTLVYGIDVPGYASLFTAVLFLGGIQLIGIGILGEYIGRIFSECKHRPIYIVRETYGRQNEVSR